MLAKTGTLSLERIDSPSALRAAEREWGELLSVCPHASPFLTHGWMLNWWEHFGAGKELRVFVLRDAGRPVLIAPLMRYRGRSLGRGALRLPVTVIESIANYHSNRADLLYAELQPRYLRALWEHLLVAERWHVLRLFPVREDSPTLAELRRLIEELDLRASFSHAQTSPYVPVDGDWEGYLGQLSSRTRKKMRRQARAVGAQYELELVRDGAGFEEAYARILEVSRRGWAAERGTAISSTPELRGFYQGLGRLAAREGWLFLSLLKAGARPVAFEFGLRYGETIHALKAAFDRDDADHSPGHLLYVLLLSELFRHDLGIREYDFMGADEPYKLSWASRTRRHVKAHVYHPRSPYARLVARLHLAFHALPALRDKLLWRHPPAGRGPARGIASGPPAAP